MTEPSPSRRTARSGGSGGGWTGLLAALMLVAAGCHTWRPPPVDLGDPAWRESHGQAVWHPARRDLELAGELLIATTADGQAYVQFGKGPVVIAEARLEAGHWLAGFPATGRTYSGPGAPPGRLAWNQLLRVALGQAPDRGWTWTGSLETRWRLTHDGSGEWIEGTRLP